MAVHVVLGRAEVKAILSAYSVGPLESFAGIPEGSINTAYRIDAGGRRYFLRITESKVPFDLEYEEALLGVLATAGLPVPRLIRRRDGAAFTERSPGRFVSLFEHMPGEELTVAGAGHVRQIGAFAARMHRALEGFHLVRANEFRIERLASKMDALLSAVREGRLDRRYAEDLDTLARELAAQSRRELSQMTMRTVHGDLFIDNAKFVGDRLVGIIDFEMASTDRVTWELAVLINAWCFDPDRGFDPVLVSAAIEGYEEERPLEDRERADLSADLRLAAARFAVTRLYDFELHPLPEGRRVYKDYRDFLARLARCIDIS